MKPTETRRIGIAATLFATVAVVGACGGFSMQPGTASSSGSHAPFTPLSEEENTELARSFKAELRMGELAETFDKGVVFARVEQICGTKIWEKCQVGYEPETNELGWKPWSFKRRDSDEVHRFPEMFYIEAEPLWAQETIEFLGKKGAKAALFIGMVEEKCGTPLDAGCEVRGRGHSSDRFQLTHRESGEVIEVMSTLYEWEEDL